MIRLQMVRALGSGVADDLQQTVNNQPFQQQPQTIHKTHHHNNSTIPDTRYDVNKKKMYFLFDFLPLATYS